MVLVRPMVPMHPPVPVLHRRVRGRGPAHGTIGAVLRWITAGESHGPALTAVLEGMVAGVGVTTADIAAELARRRLGYGRGARMKFEQDEVELLGGVRHGLTMGGPVAIRIGNTEWPKWETVMAADPVDPDVLAAQARAAALTRPRPGHADLAGMLKYGFDDIRPVLERASARETAARVALGTVARAFLRQALGVEVLSHVVALGSVAAPDGLLPGPGGLAAVDASPVRAADGPTTEAMVAEVDAARRDGDTLGGVVEVVVHGLPVGLGSYVQSDRRLDARLAGALMGIQAMKGVEVGDGFATARRRGSAAHDEMEPGGRESGGRESGGRESGGRGVHRRSNRAGGLEGGMTNGEPLRVRAAMKPISTVPRALDTVDVATGEPAVAINQRSDVCAVPAAGVVAEAMVALVLADAALEKFGGDSLAETLRHVRSAVPDGIAAHPAVAGGEPR
jgi:chorismate synthase